MGTHARTIEVTGVKFLGIGYRDERLYDVTYKINWRSLDGKNTTTVVETIRRFSAKDELDAYNKCMRDQEYWKKHHANQTEGKCP